MPPMPSPSSTLDNEPNKIKVKSVPAPLPAPKVQRPNQQLDHRLSSRMPPNWTVSDGKNSDPRTIIENSQKRDRGRPIQIGTPPEAKRKRRPSCNSDMSTSSTAGSRSASPRCSRTHSPSHSRLVRSKYKSPQSLDNRGRSRERSRDRTPTHERRSPIVLARSRSPTKESRPLQIREDIPARSSGRQGLRSKKMY